MPFTKIQFEDQPISLFQDNVGNALIPLQAMPMVGGVLISNISLVTAQDNFVKHTLGRFPFIFFIGNLNAQSTVWSPASTDLNGKNWNNSVINLRCSANCIVSMWIN